MGQPRGRNVNYKQQLKPKSQQPGPTKYFRDWGAGEAGVTLPSRPLTSLFAVCRLWLRAGEGSDFQGL